MSDQRNYASSFPKCLYDGKLKERMWYCGRHFLTAVVVLLISAELTRCVQLNESAVCWCCAVTYAGIIMVISNCNQLRVLNFVRKKAWTRTGYCSHGPPLLQTDMLRGLALAVWADWAAGRHYRTGDTDVICLIRKRSSYVLFSSLRQHKRQ
jgi:hypothetical protein